jgi:hypothetical protein
MNVKLIKKSTKMIIGGIGLLGSVSNVCVANVYMFEQYQYVVGIIWFLFGLCGAFACADYITEKTVNEN